MCAPFRWHVSALFNVMDWTVAQVLVTFCFRQNTSVDCSVESRAFEPRTLPKESAFYFHMSVVFNQQSFIRISDVHQVHNSKKSHLLKRKVQKYVSGLFEFSGPPEDFLHHVTSGCFALKEFGSVLCLKVLFACGKETPRKGSGPPYWSRE